MSVILMASGGLDSTTLAYWLLHRGVNIIPVFVNYGQHCADTELASLRQVLPLQALKDLRIIEVNGCYVGSASRMLRAADLWEEEVSDDDLYVPMRNQILLTVGAAIAEANSVKQVFSAFIESNVAKGRDCSTSFLNGIRDFIKSYTDVTLEFPFMEMTKRQVAGIGADLGVPLSQTYSCLASPLVPCGVCPNCVDRNDALETLKNRAS